MADYKVQNPDELGALWEKSGAKGPYMTGTIGGIKVVVFKNAGKSSEKQPDWRVLKSKPKDAPTEAPADNDVDF